MHEQIFDPLKMTSVVDADRDGLGVRMTAHANAYVSEPLLLETVQVLQRAGAVKAFELLSQSTLGGLDVRVYRATLEGQRYTVVTRAGIDGRLEQYTLTPD